MHQGQHLLIGVFNLVLLHQPESWKIPDLLPDHSASFPFPPSQSVDALPCIFAFLVSAFFPSDGTVGWSALPDRPLVLYQTLVDVLQGPQIPKQGFVVLSQLPPVHSRGHRDTRLFLISLLSSSHHLMGSSFLTWPNCLHMWMQVSVKSLNSCSFKVEGKSLHLCHPRLTNLPVKRPNMRMPAMVWLKPCWFGHPRPYLPKHSWSCYKWWSYRRCICPWSPQDNYSRRTSWSQWGRSPTGFLPSGPYHWGSNPSKRYAGPFPLALILKSPAIIKDLFTKAWSLNFAQRAFPAPAWIGAYRAHLWIFMVISCDG